MKARNIIIRALAAVSWFILFYVITGMLIGGVVGVVSGPDTSGYKAGYAAGKKTSVAFFQKYGTIIFAAQIITYIGLLGTGKLPGTKRYKRSESAPVSIRPPKVLGPKGVGGG